MSQRRTLYLCECGCPGRRRWLIAAFDGNYWTGRDWSRRSSDALLFADGSEAARMSQELLRREYEDVPLTGRYTVPIHIEVRSDRPIDTELLRDWLQKVIDLRVGYLAEGNGPLPDSLALLNIDFTDLSPE